MFKIDKVSRLLVQAAHSHDPADRERAFQELDALSAELEAELRAVESALRESRNRVVEAASVRAALSTLKQELAALREERTPAQSAS